MEGLAIQQKSEYQRKQSSDVRSDSDYEKQAENHAERADLMT
jgi:hypothetical protein